MGLASTCERGSPLGVCGAPRRLRRTGPHCVVSSAADHRLQDVPFRTRGHGPGCTVACAIFLGRGLTRVPCTGRCSLILLTPRGVHAPSFSVAWKVLARGVGRPSDCEKLELGPSGTLQSGLSCTCPRKKLCPNCQ